MRGLTAVERETVIVMNDEDGRRRGHYSSAADSDEAAKEPRRGGDRGRELRLDAGCHVPYPKGSDHFLGPKRELNAAERRTRKRPSLAQGKRGHGAGCRGVDSLCSNRKFGSDWALETMSKPVRRTSYTTEDIERGLSALAFHAGNSNRASAVLKEMGHPVPARTLRAWRKQEAQRYERVRAELQDRVFAETAEEWLGLTREAIEAASGAIEKAKQATREGDSKEAKTWAGTARDLAVSSGVADDKATRGAQRPTSIREERSFPELMRTLHERFPSLVTVNPAFLETTAEEVPDNE
jgi:hypothetical protein